MYAGFELFEHVARPGAEEYLDNEKYELRPRDWAAAEAQGRSLAPFLTTLNRVRRDNPALHQLRNLRFHEIDNPALLCWSKHDPETGNTVIVICSFDPRNVQWGNTTLDMPALGFDWHERFTVHDELTGTSYDWGQRNAVRLDPYLQPAHVLTVRRPTPPTSRSRRAPSRPTSPSPRCPTTSPAAPRRRPGHHVPGHDDSATVVPAVRRPFGRRPLAVRRPLRPEGRPMDQLIAGATHDPHALLGAHPPTPRPRSARCAGAPATWRCSSATSGTR